MNLIRSKVVSTWMSGFNLAKSRCENCCRSLALRHLSAHKAGIKMHGGWYCSSSCFGAAVEKRLSSLLSTGVVAQYRVSRMPLGLILVGRGLLTESEFREVTDHQRTAGGEIGEILSRQGAVSERQLAAARSAQWGCPLFSVPTRGIQSKFRIPSILVRTHSVIPVHYVAATKLLLIGFVNEIEYGLLYVIEQITGCKTQPCFITRSDFERKLNERDLRQEEKAQGPMKEVNFEGLQTPAQMANVLCDYAADLEADEIVIGKFKEHLWARFKCDANEIDILFKAA
jgi:hypothetical protein